MKTKTKGKNEAKETRPNLAVLVKRAKGVPFVEGLRMAEDRGLAIASNARLDKALVGSEEWHGFSELFACWTGTMAAYKEPERKLGECITYVDPETNQRYMFPVPKNYKETKNAILVVEHPHYTLELGKKEVVEFVQDVNQVRLPKDITESDLIVVFKNPKEISLIEGFPEKNGRYLTDAKHNIPVENQLGLSNTDARDLWRIDSRVGPVARGCFGMYYGILLSIGLGYWPSIHLGMAVEAPAEEQ